MANVAAIQGFRSGGYTGGGGVDEIAGTVHGKEFVFDADATARIGVAKLEAIRQGQSLDGAIASVSAESGHNGGAPNVQIINNGQPMTATSQLDGDTLRIILDSVRGDVMSDGKIKQAIGQKFGLEGVGR
jgi:phage-related minor tail protein